MSDKLWTDERIATELAEITVHQWEGKSPPRFDDELLYKMRDDYEARIAELELERIALWHTIHTQTEYIDALEEEANDE